MAPSVPRLAFHEMMGRLGVGDLHPGGLAISKLFMDQLRAHGARRVLEVGAGIGVTTERLLEAGFDVAPLEPNPVLRGELIRRLGIHVHDATFERFDDRDGSYDAVLAEGVFYALGLQSSVAKVHRLLRPGGLLASVDLLWTPAAKPDAVAFIHDQTRAVFGIPMAPREIVTSSDWTRALRAAQFSEVFTRKLDPADFDADGKRRRKQIGLGLLANPGLVPLFLTYRVYRKISWAPPGWLESWATVWTRP
jgi:SAM-dependent methyltransferase